MPQLVQVYQQGRQSREGFQVGEDPRTLPFRPGRGGAGRVIIGAPVPSPWPWTVVVQFGKGGQERRNHFAIELTQTIEQRRPKAPKDFVGRVQDALLVLRQGRIRRQPRPQIGLGRDVWGAGEAGPHYGPPDRPAAQGQQRRRAVVDHHEIRPDVLEEAPPSPGQAEQLAGLREADVVEDCAKVRGTRTTSGTGPSLHGAW